MARVTAATSLGVCVPTGASRPAGLAAVLTDVLTLDTDAPTDGSKRAGATEGDLGGIIDDAIDTPAVDAWL